ncbi:hypothetical protein IWX47DRAFT_862754 [Phyllosticta citricarpa]
MMDTHVHAGNFFALVYLLALHIRRVSFSLLFSSSLGCGFWDVVCSFHVSTASFLFSAFCNQFSLFALLCFALLCFALLCFALYQTTSITTTTPFWRDSIFAFLVVYFCVRLSERVSEQLADMKITRLA